MYTKIWELFTINPPFILKKKFYSSVMNKEPGFIIIAGKINENYYMYYNIYKKENESKFIPNINKTDLINTIIEFWNNFNNTYYHISELELNDINNEDCINYYKILSSFNDKRYLFVHFNNDLKHKFGLVESGFDGNMYGW